MQKAWDNDLAFPFTAMAKYLLNPHLISYYGWDLAVVSFIFVLFAVILTVFMFRDPRIPGEYLLYTVLSIFFIVSRDNLTASLRFLLPVFPLFLLLAVWIHKRRTIYDFIVYVFASLQIFYFLSFIHYFNWAAN
jgi:hypothetical protein